MKKTKQNNETIYILEENMVNSLRLSDLNPEVAKASDLEILLYLRDSFIKRGAYFCSAH